MDKEYINEHKHEWIEVKRELLNGFESSNGHSSEYNVTRRCIECGVEKSNWELGW